MKDVGFFWGARQTWYEIEYQDRNGSLRRGWVAAAVLALAGLSGTAPGPHLSAGLGIIASALAQEPQETGKAAVDSGAEFLKARSSDAYLFSALLLVINGLAVLFKLYMDAGAAATGSGKSIFASIDRFDVVKSLVLTLISILVYVGLGGGHDLGPQPAVAPSVLVSIVNGYGFPSLMKDIIRLLPRFLSS